MKRFMLLLGVAMIAGCVSPAERMQAQREMDASVPVCSTEAQCKVAWDTATAWVSQHCGMKIETQTDSLIQTFNSPPDSPNTACVVTRAHGNGPQQAITIRVGCSNIFGCVPGSKDTVVAFGSAIKAAIAPYEPIKIGAVMQMIDGKGYPTVVDAESTGLRVVSIMPKSRAERAGLQAGDLITAFDGSRIRNNNQWLKSIASKGAGDTIQLSVVRNSQPVEIAVTL